MNPVARLACTRFPTSLRRACRGATEPMRVDVARQRPRRAAPSPTLSPARPVPVPRSSTRRGGTEGFSTWSSRAGSARWCRGGPSRTTAPPRSEAEAVGVFFWGGPWRFMPGVHDEPPARTGRVLPAWSDPILVLPRCRSYVSAKSPPAARATSSRIEFVRACDKMHREVPSARRVQSNACESRPWPSKKLSVKKIDHAPLRSFVDDRGTLARWVLGVMWKSSSSRPLR